MKQERKSRVKKAEKKALERLDSILESRSELDFVEVVGRKGSDVITFRIYDDGTLYER